MIQRRQFPARPSLLATTAMVASGLSAGQATADDGKIALGLSGYYRASAGFLVGGDQTATAAGGGLGDFGRTSGGFRQEIRINFTGGTTLDNGIKVNLQVGLNPLGASSGNSALNSAYVTFEGHYGQVRFGVASSPMSDLDALSRTCVYDPGNVTANFGVNSANQIFTNAGLARTHGGAAKTVGVATFETAAATCATMTGHATSINYFSPTMGEFSWSVSYTPEAATANSSGSQGFGSGTDLKQKTAENILSAGAHYVHDYGKGLKLTIGGGGQWAFDGHTKGGSGLPLDHKPSQYSLGFQVGRDIGWTVGASGAYYVSYPNQGFFQTASTDAGTSGADGWVAAAGVSYTTAEFALGLEGIYGSYQVHQGSPNAGHDKVWGIGLTGTYALSTIKDHTIKLEGQIAYTAYDPAFPIPSATNPMRYGALEIDTGIAILF